MKKIVGTIAALALVASAAFAEVGIGAWGRGVWAPVAGNSKDVISFSVPSWAWSTAYQGPRVGISIHGDSENVGFNIDMNGDKGGIGAGDTQYIWVKPWSFLEVQVGQIQDNQARGDACFGAFNWLRNSAMAGTGEDFTFTRFGNGKGGQAKGAIVKVTPVEGLWIEACFDDVNGGKAADVFGHAQYGAGYRIDGIGHIRAQFIGKDHNIGTDEAPVAIITKDNTKANGKIEAAFDLTAVENLFVTVGAKIPLNDKKNGEGDSILAKEVNVYASYGFGAAKVHVLAGFGLNANYNTILIGAGIDYDLGNGLSLAGDFRFGSTNPKEGDGYSAISFLAGIQKGFSNGYIGAGFQGTTDTAGKNFLFDGEAKENAFAWQIPVTVSYWF